MVAISTTLYVIYTKELVNVTIEMRKGQFEPHISIYVQQREDCLFFFDFILVNLGAGPAYDIKFQIIPTITTRAGGELGQVGFIQKGIKYFASGQKIQFFLLSTNEDFDNIMKNTTNIKVNYKDREGKEFSEVFEIDFESFRNTSQLGDPPLYSMADDIEEIRKDIHSIITHDDKLKIEGPKKDEGDPKISALERIRRERKYRMGNEPGPSGPQ